jgi:hypothetical protein
MGCPIGIDLFGRLLRKALQGIFQKSLREVLELLAEHPGESR